MTVQDGMVVSTFFQRKNKETAATQYALLLSLLKDKVVLDVNCGDGYGAFLLSHTAKKVVGTDPDPDLIDSAGKYYRKKNLQFLSCEAWTTRGTDVFDAVIMLDADPGDNPSGRTAQDIASWVSPRGFLVLSTSDGEDERTKDFLQKLAGYLPIRTGFETKIAGKEERIHVEGRVSADRHRSFTAAKDAAWPVMLLSRDPLALNGTESVITPDFTAPHPADSYVRKLQALIREREEEMNRLKGRLDQSEFRLDQILGSEGWRLLLFLYRIRDAVFPANSKRKTLARKLRLAIQRRFRVDSAPVHAIDEGPPPGENPQVRLVASSAPAALCSELPPFRPLRNGGRILVMDRGLPTYDQDSGSQRMILFLRILRRLGYRTSFFFADGVQAQPYLKELKALGIETVSPADGLEAYLQKVGDEFSSVVLSRPEQALAFMPLIRAYCVHARVFYDTVDLHWVRFERGAALNNDAAQAAQADYFRKIEAFNISCSDVVFTVTEDEKQLIASEMPEARVEVVPNIHELMAPGKGFEDRRDLMFIGGFWHKPNEDAALFFHDRIFPLVRRKLPDVRFYCVGSNPSEAMLSLGSDDFIVTGYQKDVSPYFRDCRVFVSPLRYGAGMKGKIGQSMAYGLPVVTTSIGAEGIGLVDGQSALIADDEEGFADAVIRLYSDEVLWNRLARAEREIIQDNYSVETIQEKMRQILS